jgi:hypothetical protein
MCQTTVSSSHSYVEYKGMSMDDRLLEEYLLIGERRPQLSAGVGVCVLYVHVRKYVCVFVCVCVCVHVGT